MIDKHLSFESSAAKDFNEDKFFSSAGTAFHNFVPNAGNIWSRSLVRVLIGGKLPSTTLESILCHRTGSLFAPGYSLIIPGKILLRYVRQKLLEILKTIFSTRISLLVARGIQPVSLYKLEVFDLAGAPVTALIVSTTMWSSLDRTLIGAPAQIISAYSMIGLMQEKKIFSVAFLFNLFFKNFNIPISLEHLSIKLYIY